MKSKASRLYLWVLAAIVAGGLLGHFAPDIAVSLKPLGDGFIALIKMLIAPVIFLTVVLGVAGAANARKVGRVGARAILYFEVVSTFALIIGMIVVNVLKPGAGFNIDPATLDAGAVAHYAQQAHEQSTVQFLLHIIPKTFLDAFSGNGDLLQVLLLALMFGFALTRIGEAARPVVTLLESLSQTFFRMIAMVTRLAPIGAGAAMAFTIGKYGVESLGPLLRLMAGFYLSCALFVLVVLGLIARLTGFSILRFLRYIREELLIVLGASSSEAALPLIIAKLQRLGAGKTTVGLVVPTGYSFNLDGTNIYMTLATLFLAQATNIHLSWQQELSLLGVAMLTSKGASGVSGAGFITLAATLAVIPDLPIASLALLVGVDRFMSACRALTNFVGNGVGTLVIAGWEGDLDRDRLRAELDRGPLPEPEAVLAGAPAD